MDGFDDLLSSSSRPLDVNPFANPFAQPRSSSPDPWATFGQPEAHDDASADATGYSSLDSTYDVYAAEGGRSVEEHHPQHGEEASQELESSKEFISTDTTPIESPPSRHFPLSPGFRESVSNEASSLEDARG